MRQTEGIKCLAWNQIFRKNSESFPSTFFNYYCTTILDLPTQNKADALLGISALALMGAVILSLGTSPAYADSNAGPHKTMIVDRPLPPGSPIVAPKHSEVMPLTGPAVSLEVRIGYNFPCGFFICNHIVQDWTALPYQTLTPVFGNTKESYTWIRPWYEIRAGYTGTYHGNRLSNANDPDGKNMYSNSGTWTFHEANMLEPAHQDMDEIFHNGTGVPKGSLIFHDFYFSSYAPS